MQIQKSWTYGLFIVSVLGLLLIDGGLLGRGLAQTPPVPAELNGSWENFDEGDSGISFWKCLFEPPAPCDQVIQVGDKHTAGDASRAQLGTDLLAVGNNIGTTDAYEWHSTVQPSSDGAFGVIFNAQDSTHYYRISYDNVGKYQRIVKRMGSRFMPICEINTETLEVFEAHFASCAFLPSFSPNAYERNADVLFIIESNGTNISGETRNFVGGLRDIIFSFDDPNAYPALGSTIGYYSSRSPGTKFITQAYLREGSPPPHLTEARIERLGNGRGVVRTIDAGGTPVPGVYCWYDCIEYSLDPHQTLLLEATPFPGYTFSQWTIDRHCSGRRVSTQTTPIITLNLMPSGDDCLTAAFDFTGPIPPEPSLDLDGNGEATSDVEGRVILAYLLGLRGNSLMRYIPTPHPPGFTAETLVATLDQLRGSALDVDLDHVPNPMTDGNIIFRFLSGFTGQDLVLGVINPMGLRTSPEEIHEYLSWFLP